jgi:hypothetical protein
VGDEKVRRQGSESASSSRAQGSVEIEHKDGVTKLSAGQGLLLKKGERVRW